MRSFPWLEDAWRDLRYGARLLLRNPGFTAVVVCSLALGIGANTALFSVMDAMMLRMLPVPRADEIVRLRTALSFGDRPYLIARIPKAVKLKVNPFDAATLSEWFGPPPGGHLRAALRRRMAWHCQ